MYIYMYICMYVDVDVYIKGVTGGGLDGAGVEVAEKELGQ
jgi:hypothetical protein